MSAFRQAVIVSYTPDHTDLHCRVTYIDSSFEQAVILKTGLFEGNSPTYIAQRKLSNWQTFRKGTLMVELENENGGRGGDAPPPRPRSSPSSPRPGCFQRHTAPSARPSTHTAPLLPLQQTHQGRVQRHAQRPERSLDHSMPTRMSTSSCTGPFRDTRCSRGAFRYTTPTRPGSFPLRAPPAARSSR